MQNSPSLSPYRMAWSFRAGRLFGIDIRVHVIFLLLIAWFTLTPVLTSGSLLKGATVLLYLLLLFGFVLLHELGHSLMAQRYGIRVLDITLWPLGGLARLEGYTENPKVELRIAIAGPAVNLVLALLLFPFCYRSGQGSLFYDLGYEGFGALLDFAFRVNLLMGLVNLIPAFPLDGGRILRAILALKMRWLRATEIAVFVGRILVWSIMLLFVILGNYWIVIICLFILWAGSGELRAARARAALRAAAGYPETGPDILDAKVVPPRHDPEGDGPSGPPPLPGDGGRPLKPFERDFIEQVKRFRRGGGGS